MSKSAETKMEEEKRNVWTKCPNVRKKFFMCLCKKKKHLIQPVAKQNVSDASRVLSKNFPVSILS